MYSFYHWILLLQLIFRVTDLVNKTRPTDQSPLFGVRDGKDCVFVDHFETTTPTLESVSVVIFPFSAPFTLNFGSINTSVENRCISGS